MHVSFINYPDIPGTLKANPLAESARENYSKNLIKHIKNHMLVSMKSFFATKAVNDAEFALKSPMLIEELNYYLDLLPHHPPKFVKKQ